jgi:hypothetical protein
MDSDLLNSFMATLKSVNDSLLSLTKTTAKHDMAIKIMLVVFGAFMSGSVALGIFIIKHLMTGDHN